MGHRFAPVVLVRNGKNFLNCRRYEQTKQDAGTDANGNNRPLGFMVSPYANQMYGKHTKWS